MSQKNRPDERKREEAKLARANQAKPRNYSPQSSKGGSKFEILESSASDSISQSIQTFLRPYHNVLTGVNGVRSRSVETPSSSRDTSKTDPFTPNNVDDGGSNAEDLVDGVGALGSRPSQSSGSHRNTRQPPNGQPKVDTGQYTQNKPSEHEGSCNYKSSARPPLLPTPTEKASSGSSPNFHEEREPFSGTHKTGIGSLQGHKEADAQSEKGNQKPSDGTKQPPSRTAKLKNSNPFSSSPSQLKSHHFHLSKTKSTKESLSVTSLNTNSLSVNSSPVHSSSSSVDHHHQRKASAPSSSVQGSHSSTSLSHSSSSSSTHAISHHNNRPAGKDHSSASSISSSNTTIIITTTTTTFTATAKSHSTVSLTSTCTTTSSSSSSQFLKSGPSSLSTTSAALKLSTRTHSPPRQRRPSPLPPRPRSTTPTKPSGSAMPLNGLQLPISEHSKSTMPTSSSSTLVAPSSSVIISSSPSLPATTSTMSTIATAKPVSSTLSSAEKTKALKLNILAVPKATTKRDLQGIFDEMTVQPLHTAIKTPHKDREKFPFPAVSAIANKLEQNNASSKEFKASKLDPKAPSQHQQSAVKDTTNINEEKLVNHVTDRCHSSPDPSQPQQFQPASSVSSSSSTKSELPAPIHGPSTPPLPPLSPLAEDNDDVDMEEDEIGSPNPQHRTSFVGPRTPPMPRPPTPPSPELGAVHSRSPGPDGDHAISKSDEAEIPKSVGYHNNLPSKLGFADPRLTEPSTKGSFTASAELKETYIVASEKDIVHSDSEVLKDCKAVSPITSVPALKKLPTSLSSRSLGKAISEGDDKSKTHNTTTHGSATGILHAQNAHGWAFMPHYNSLFANKKAGPPSSVGAALDELMCGGRTDGNLSSASSTVSPSSLYNCSSVLEHDLDISDSDTDTEHEVSETSANQSKKGKVMDHTEKGKSPSSGSSSSSDQSSESAGEEDEETHDDDVENDEDEEAKNVPKEGDKSSTPPKSEIKESSSSSSSSSESSSESDSGEEEEDRKKTKKDDELEEVKVAKAPVKKWRSQSPPSVGNASGPGSVGNVLQENFESEMSWRLDNFKPRPKFSSFVNSHNTSSPSKLTSPSSGPSLGDDLVLPPSDRVPEDKPRSLKDIGPCNTMPFDVSKSTDKEDHERNEGDEDENSDDEEEDDMDCENKDDSDYEVKKVVRKKKSPLAKKPKESSLSVKQNRVSSKVKEQKDSVAKRKSGLSSSKLSVQSSKKVGNNNKAHGKQKGSVSTSSLSKSQKDSISNRHKERTSRCGDSRVKTEEGSEDEIDVVSLTPDKVPELSNGLLSSSDSEEEEEEVFQSLKSQCKEDRQQERRMVNSSKSSIASGRQCLDSVKVDKKSTMDHIVSMSHPPLLLSPFHSDCSPPPGASSKPLPPFHTSFSPAPHLISSDTFPPIVTVTRTSDGNSLPRILVQVRREFLLDTAMQRLRERKERRARNIAAEKVKDYDVHSDDERKSLSTETRVPAISHNPSATFVNTRKELSKQQSSSNSPDRTPFNSLSNSIASPSTMRPGKRKQSDSQEVNDRLSSHSHQQPQKMSKSSKSIKDASLPPPSLASPPAATAPSSNNAEVTSSPPQSLSSSDNKSNKLHSSFSPVRDLPNKKSAAVKNLSDFDPDGVHPGQSTKALVKRKPDFEDSAGETATSKKLKKENAQAAVKTEEDMPTVQNVPSGHTRHRRDSTASTSSRSSQRSTSSKKSSRRFTSANNNNNIKLVPKTEESTPTSNGPLEPSNLPFNDYANGTASATTTPASQKGLVGLLANLPMPSPPESKLQSHEHYMSRAKQHKHYADGLKDKLAKLEPYLRSGLSFFLAGYSMEPKPSSYTMYRETSNLMQFVANSSVSSEPGDRERKLMAIIIRLRAFLNHRMYHLKRMEVNKLRNRIESEQHNKIYSKPHAPSPHQSNNSGLNKNNSMGTPSSMSPTPSPAGSVSSQGSCELPPGKLSNGTASSTAMTSPSPGAVSVPKQVHDVSQRYIALTSHLVKAMELWERANEEAKGLDDFFSVIDNACGPLAFHSDPTVVVHYMKHALKLLNLAQPP